MCRSRSRPRKRRGALTANATPREQAHVAALEAWIAGDLDRALGVWEQILSEHPLDVRGVSARAFQQFLARAAGRDARLGRAREAEMGRAICRATARSCPAIASRTRSAATMRSPSRRAAPRSRSIRATSGARMRSRTSWRCRAATPKASPGSTSWSGTGRAATTCCIICGGTARCFISSGASSTRCSISTTSASAISPAPLTQAQPDLYIDVQNAASMLFRLELLGIDVGERWNEIADKAEARIGDCLSAFTLPHWMMALAATGRDDAARRMLDGDARVRRGRGDGAAHRRATSRCRSAKPCAAHRHGDHRARRRPDAAGARRHAPARRQPCAAGRADAALPRQRREGRLRRRRASHTWITRATRRFRT